MTLLNLDDTMIERMESDLATKASAAFTGASLTTGVHGVFSIDDLENKLESELCGNIAVGVGYMGAEPTAFETQPKAPLNVARGEAVKSLDFIFTVILAVPTGSDCTQRYDATKLLTILRRKIMGSAIDGDQVQRCWAFVREGPQISASTETMLYYSQVWRVALPHVGNINS
jgi:hypothetical protein